MTSGATVGVGGMTAGNSGIHAGHRAALAKLDAEEAARKKPAPVVEEPVVQEPVKETVVVEPVVEREVVREPIVERVSQPVYTSSTIPVNLPPVSDIPTSIPVGARIGHSTIISGSPPFCTMCQQYCQRLCMVWCKVFVYAQAHLSSCFVHAHVCKCNVR